MPDGTVHAQDEKEQNETKEEAQEVETTEVETTEEQIDEVKERPIYTMPVSKAQEEKKRAVEKASESIKQEYEEKLSVMKAEYDSKVSGGDNELAEFAKENNLDVDAAKGLLDIFKKSVPSTDMSKYDKLLEKQEIETHRLQVSSDFDNNVISLIKLDFPSVTDSHIKKIKDEIEQLAFTEKYRHYEISDIYKAKKSGFEFKDNFSGEDTGGRSDTTSVAGLSEDEANKLPPAQYAIWANAQAAKHSRYNKVE